MTPPPTIPTFAPVEMAAQPLFGGAAPEGEDVVSAVAAAVATGPTLIVVVATGGPGSFTSSHSSMIAAYDCPAVAGPSQ